MGSSGKGDEEEEQRFFLRWHSKSILNSIQSLGEHLVTICRIHNNTLYVKSLGEYLLLFFLHIFPPYNPCCYISKIIRSLLRCCDLTSYFRFIYSFKTCLVSESTSEVLRTFQQLQDDKQKSERQKMR